MNLRRVAHSLALVLFVLSGAQLLPLLLREQCPDLDQRPDAVLVKLGLGLPDGVGLPHHRRLIGSVLG